MKLIELLNSSRETHKNEAGQHNSTLKELKAIHEADVVEARESAVSLLLDKLDLQISLDRMKFEANCAARQALHLGSFLTPNGADTADSLTLANQDNKYVFGVLPQHRWKIGSVSRFPGDGFGGDERILTRISPSPI